MRTYVDTIEPRLTPNRDVAPADAGQTLAEWTTDLRDESAARCALASHKEMRWQPYPDGNSPGVTLWHVARWLDVLGTRVLTGATASSELWQRNGWAAATGYDPTGLGFLGLGTLTGYTPQQMRDVPVLPPALLSEYVIQSADELVVRLRALGGDVVDGPRIAGSTPYQLVGSTLQGSFGHLGEIDALIALHARSA